MLIERMLRKGESSQAIGFIEMPNLDMMSHKQLLELYVKLKKEEKEQTEETQEDSALLADQ
jgi:hypothetical protein